MIQRNSALQAYNTFGIDAQADFFLPVTSEHDIQAFLDDNRGHMPPVFVLGGGSNILLLGDVKAVVLKMDIKGISVVEESETEVTVKVGAGETWHNFVMQCLENDWGGLENLALIPGSVGAAPIQNIGAYGVEQAACFVKLEALHLRTGMPYSFTCKDCQFGYRDSIFKRSHKGEYIITYVYYRLQKAPHTVKIDYYALKALLEQQGVSDPGITEIAQAVIQVRQSKLPDPAQIGNSGSFFKNPVIDAAHFGQLHKRFPEMPHYPQTDGSVKVPAGWLIEQCGWKGFKEKNYGVHEKQALVLVNYGQATGKEIYALSERILQDVKQRFEILLEREVNVIGKLS